MLLILRPPRPITRSLVTDEATPLRPIDPLAHRALEALVRAQANLTRRLAADLERIGVSATGFTMLVLLTSAGGRLELRTMRRRPVAVSLSEAGYNLVTHAFPAHAERVREAFGVLDETEKRQLADLCRKLDRAA